MLQRQHQIALAILCGGQSRRLGTDKGLFSPLDDETLVCRAIRILSDDFDEILISVRDDEQASLYREVLQRDLDPLTSGRVKVIWDTLLPGRRPDAALTGLETSLALTSKDGVVAVPVDQVGVRPLHLRKLLRSSGPVRCFADDTDLIPFPCFVGKSALEPLSARVDAGALGVRNTLAVMGAQTLTAEDYAGELAFNGNTQAELADYFGEPLFDPFGRRLHYLRFSLTEACNLSCTYCLPEGFPEWYRHKARLAADDVTTLLRGFRRLGFRKVRLTGGEPTIHPGCLDAVKTARRLGYEWIAMTTNGLLIKDVDRWIDAGLNQINISMDSLDADGFYAVTKSREVDVVRGLVETCAERGILTKVNAVLVRDKNGAREQIEQMLDWALDLPISLRFIELMDTKLNQNFARTQRVLGSEILPLMEARGLIPAKHEGRSPILAGPATDYWHPDRPGSVGLINPLSCNFCDKCNRLRITARGQLKMCLFGDHDQALNLTSPDSVAQDVRRLVAHKPEKHELEKGKVGNVSTFRTIGG